MDGVLARDREHGWIIYQSNFFMFINLSVAKCQEKKIFSKDELVECFTCRLQHTT